MKPEEIVSTPDFVAFVGYLFDYSSSYCHADLPDFLISFANKLDARSDAPCAAELAEIIVGLLSAPLVSEAPTTIPAKWEIDVREKADKPTVIAFIRHQAAVMRAYWEEAMNNPYRFFGIELGQFGTWYNFEPRTYLVCGASCVGDWIDADEGWSLTAHLAYGGQHYPYP